MALFDNLSRKASEISARAIQKTKEISDITRLNAQISEEEKRQNNCYYQLGKQYYSIHSTDGEDVFKPLISSITESEKKLSEMKKQVQDLKGVQRCEKCGAEVEKGAAFCSSCGSPMPQAVTYVASSDIVTCTSCGAKVKKGTRFCTSCGKPMEQPAVIQIEEQQETVKCPNCGADLEAGSVFCTECGTPLNGEEAH